jgi:cell division protein FtsQ
MTGDPGIKRSLGSALLMVVLVAGGVVAVVWANLWKANLRVATVSVTGNAVVGEKDILALAKISKEEKLYSVDLLAAQQRILQNAFVRSAVVNREAPDRISITIEERQPLAAVVLDRMEYLDAEGVVLPAARSSSLFDLPVLTGSFQPADFVPGKRTTRDDVNEALQILETARRINDALYRRISEVHVEGGKDIIMYGSEYGVPVIMGHGDVAEKLVKFEGFWKQVVLHQGADRLEYVDLRFQDQVVVRWHRDTEENHATPVVLKKSH